MGNVCEQEGRMDRSGMPSAEEQGREAEDCNPLVLSRAAS